MMTDTHVHEAVRREDVTDGDLELLAQVRRIRSRASRESASTIMLALMATGVELVEPASVAQARRQAKLRNGLLATECFTYATLSQLRDEKENATRTTVNRWVRGRRMFTVPSKGRTIIPAFQLDAEGQPREDLTPLLEPLMGAGMGSWQLWAWLTQPAALLSGLVPQEAAADPSTAERAANAARRMAARISPANSVA